MPGPVGHHGYLDLELKESPVGFIRGPMQGGQAGLPFRVGDGTSPTGEVRLIVGVLRGIGMQRIAAIAFEVAALWRRRDEAEQPTIGDDG